MNNINPRNLLHNIDSMTSADLLECITSNGYSCTICSDEIDGFSNLSDGKSLVCTTFKDSYKPKLSRTGTALLLRHAPGILLISTFDGRTWRVRRRRQVLCLIHAILSGSNKKVPAKFTKQVLKEFGIEEYSVIQVFPQCNITCLYDEESDGNWNIDKTISKLPRQFNKKNIIGFLLAWADSIRIGKHDLIYARKGQCRIITRMSPTEVRQSITIAINGNKVIESQDHLSLINQLHEELNVSVFDIGWNGIRIEQENPYYGFLEK